MNVVMGIFIVFLALLVALGSYTVAIEAQKPTFTLIRADWKCTAERVEKQPQMVGKIMVIARVYHCDKYERK